MRDDLPQRPQGGPHADRPAGAGEAAAGDAVLAAIAHRLRARSERQQLLTERLRSGELRPGALADLAELAAAARRGARDGDHILVLAGAPPRAPRIAAPPTPLGQALSTVVAASEVASRTVVPPTPSVSLEAATEPIVAQILAELLAHAGSVTPPGERIELHTRWGPDGGVVLEVQSAQPPRLHTPLDELDDALGSARPSGPVAPQEIGLHVAARLARAIGARLGVRGPAGTGGSAPIAVLHLPTEVVGGGQRPEQPPAPAPPATADAGPTGAILRADGLPDPSPEGADTPWPPPQPGTAREPAAEPVPGPSPVVGTRSAADHETGPSVRPAAESPADRFPHAQPPHAQPSPTQGPHGQPAQSGPPYTRPATGPGASGTQPGTAAPPNVPGRHGLLPGRAAANGQGDPAGSGGPPGAGPPGDTNGMPRSAERPPWPGDLAPSRPDGRVPAAGDRGAGTGGPGTPGVGQHGPGPDVPGAVGSGPTGAAPNGAGPNGAGPHGAGADGADRIGPGPSRHGLARNGAGPDAPARHAPGSFGSGPAPRGPGGTGRRQGPPVGGPPPGGDVLPVTEALPVAGTTPPVELFGPFDSEVPVPVDDLDNTPIFAAVASAWFREPVTGDTTALPVTGANGHDATPDGDWRTPGDAEFDAARIRADRVVDLPTTAQGLPQRRPGQAMVPPSWRDTPNGTRPSGSRERQPERVRTRLASYQRGLREGRHRAAEDQPPAPVNGTGHVNGAAPVNGAGHVDGGDHGRNAG